MNKAMTKAEFRAKLLQAQRERKYKKIRENRRRECEFRDYKINCINPRRIIDL